MRRPSLSAAVLHFFFAPPPRLPATLSVKFAYILSTGALFLADCLCRLASTLHITFPSCDLEFFGMNTNSVPVVPNRPFPIRDPLPFISTFIRIDHDVFFSRRNGNSFAILPVAASSFFFGGFFPGRPVLFLFFIVPYSHRYICICTFVHVSIERYFVINFDKLYRSMMVMVTLRFFVCLLRKRVPFFPRDAVISGIIAAAGATGSCYNKSGGSIYSTVASK